MEGQSKKYLFIIEISGGFCNANEHCNIFNDVSRDFLKNFNRYLMENGTKERLLLTLSQNLQLLDATSQAENCRKNNVMRILHKKICKIFSCSQIFDENVVCLQKLWIFRNFMEFYGILLYFAEFSFCQ